MIPLLLLGGLAVAAGLRVWRRRRASAAAADLAEHTVWAARMRAVAAGDVVLLEAHRRARAAVQRTSLAADVADSVGGWDV